MAAGPPDRVQPGLWRARILPGPWKTEGFYRSLSSLSRHECRALRGKGRLEREGWRLTPKAGLVHSYLDAAGGRELMEDGQPTERFKDIVPFIEAAAERRLGEHFGIGLYLRHVFEDFGDSQAWGISLSWNH